MCPKALQLIMISADNHNITRLLLLAIIDSGKQVDVLPSKNQALYDLIYNVLYYISNLLLMVSHMSEDSSLRNT